MLQILQHATHTTAYLSYCNMLRVTHDATRTAACYTYCSILHVLKHVTRNARCYSYCSMFYMLRATSPSRWRSGLRCEKAPQRGVRMRKVEARNTELKSTWWRNWRTRGTCAEPHRPLWMWGLQTIRTNLLTADESKPIQDEQQDQVGYARRGGGAGRSGVQTDRHVEP